MPGILVQTELERLLELFDKVKAAVEADPSAVDPSETSRDLESLTALWSKVTENAERASTTTPALSAQDLLRERDTLREESAQLSEQLLALKKDCEFLQSCLSMQP